MTQPDAHKSARNPLSPENTSAIRRGIAHRDGRFITPLYRVGRVRWEFYHAHPIDRMTINVYLGRRRRFTIIFGRISERSRSRLTDPPTLRGIRWRLTTIVPSVITIQTRRTNW